MGTHHILKDGTSYAIKGGTGLIAGTSYQIGGGRTLIDGTVYEIEFGSAAVTVTISNGDTNYMFIQVNGAADKTTSGIMELTTADTITVVMGGTTAPWSSYIPRIYRNGTLVKQNEAGGRITYDFKPKQNATITFGLKQGRYCDAYIVEE